MIVGESRLNDSAEGLAPTARRVWQPRIHRDLLADAGENDSTSVEVPAPSFAVRFCPFEVEPLPIPPTSSESGSPRKEKGRPSRDGLSLVICATSVAEGQAFFARFFRPRFAAFPFFVVPPPAPGL